MLFKMSTFRVLTLGEFVTGSDIEVAISSFLEFYQGITAKHQKKSRLIIIEETPAIQNIQKFIERKNIEAAVEIINRAEQELVIKAYKNANVMLFPAYTKKGSVMIEALSYGLPILCYSQANLEDYVDHTCGMLIESISRDQSIQEFANKLRILYFDPEASKILQRGAKNKYKNQFTWSLNRHH